MGYHSKTKNPSLKQKTVAPAPEMNVIIRKSEAAQDLAKYLHGKYPPSSEDTLIKTTKQNHFSTWHGLT